MSGFILRDYQEEAIARVLEARDRGVMRQLGVAATGAGKTCIFSALAKQLDVPTLILAHRDELISQAVEKLKVVWPDVDVGVVKAARNEIDHQVVVASVQTLRKPRLAKLPPDMFHGGLIITDEAHHASSVSYTNIYEHFGCGTDGGPLHFGVTATPDRGDGTGLDKVFEEIVFAYDMLWGIRAGYLSDLIGMRIHLKNVDFTKAKIRQGDYDAGEVGQMLENADAPELIVEAWMAHAIERKTLVFTPTVATAVLTTEAFQAQGIAAETISANTPLEERRDLLRQFSIGNIRVLCNVGVLSEGFDDPAVSCIVVARPTKSRALYAQIVGRASRKHPDKTNALIMDVCGASADNSLVTIPTLFGIKKENEFEKGEKTIGEMVFEEEEEKVRKGQMEARAIDLFKKVLDSPINWTHFTARSGLRTYAVNLGSRELGSVVIERDPDGPPEDERQWHAYVRWNSDQPVPASATNVKRFANGDAYTTLINKVDLEMAQGVGEDYVRKNAQSYLVNKNAAWRDGPPTAKQLEAARKWRIVVKPEWTKGDVTDAISEKAERSRHNNRDRKPPPKYISDRF